MPEYNTTPQVQDAAVRRPSHRHPRCCWLTPSQGIAKMRAAGRLAADILEMAGALVRPGVQTEEIDRAVHEATVAAGAYPSPLNYGAFPKSVCTSVNEVICHGIPDSTVLQEGDIVNIDVTVYLDGHHGDTSRTFLVGSVDPQASQLVDVTRQALEAGIAVCRPGAPFKAIGAAIHALADSHGLGCCPGFCGHGVGKAFHSGPTILHTRNSEPGVMAVGQTFTIEPMLTLTKAGVKERFWDDGWTAVTVDGSWSAQFEHTLLITADGVEVLTLTQAAATARAAAGAAAPVEPAAAPAAAPARTQAAKPAPAVKQKRRPGGGGKERAWTFE